MPPKIIPAEAKPLPSSSGFLSIEFNALYPSITEIIDIIIPRQHKGNKLIIPHIKAPAAPFAFIAVPD